MTEARAPEAVLFSQMQPGADWEDDFNDWYDREHVPARLALPGFTAACRYTAVQGSPKYAVAYYMRGLEVLETPGYTGLKQHPDKRSRRMLASVSGFTRYVAEEINRFARPAAPVDPVAAPFLYVVLFAVPPEAEAEFNRWYDKDHCPILLRNRHWWQIRRFRIREGTPDRWTHLALHYLGDLAALESAERSEARRSPWREQIASRSWFQPAYAVYSRLPMKW